MILADIEELVLYDVNDRGLPNSERISIYARETVDIGSFGIMVGHAEINNTARPAHDNLFWFGSGIVNQGDWIIVYTGKGQPRVHDGEQPGTKIYVAHWGRETTMFTNTNIVPILFRIDAVAIGKSPTDVPQLGVLNP